VTIYNRATTCTSNQSFGCGDSETYTLMVHKDKLASYEKTNQSGYIFDGVVFPIIYDSLGSDLATFDYNIVDFPNQLMQARSQLSKYPATKLYPMLYATGFSDVRMTSVNYIKQVGELSLMLADGVVMYHLQTPYLETGHSGDEVFEVKPKRDAISALFEN
jgi:hypothetical protein